MRYFLLIFLVEVRSTRISFFSQSIQTYWGPFWNSYSLFFLPGKNQQLSPSPEPRVFCFFGSDSLCPLTMPKSPVSTSRDDHRSEAASSKRTSKPLAMAELVLAVPAVLDWFWDLGMRSTSEAKNAWLCQTTKESLKKLKRYETRKTKKRKESKKGKKGKIDTLIIRKKYIPRRKLQQNRKQRCFQKSDNQPEKSHESIQGQQEPKTFCQRWMAISF